VHQRTLYLLRHGEIATPGILTGKTDVALSELGWQQLRKTSQELPKISQCISSPLQRCHSFAVEFTKKNKIKLEVDDRLKEMNFGDWDGKSYQSLWQNESSEQQVSIGDFWQDPWQHSAPNGEAMTDFVKRVDTWWQQWLANELEGNCLILAHGGVIKHLVARVLNMPIPGTTHMSHIDIPYAGIVKIAVYRDEKGKTWPRIVW